MAQTDPEVLVQRRIKMVLSQEELALKLGCDRKTVLRWEKNGRIKEAHLKALMRLAGEITLPDPNETVEARRKRDPWAPLTPADKKYIDAWAAGLPIPEWLRD